MIQSSFHSQKPRRPEKYKLIKTMEGSPVMAQWRQMSQIDLDAAVSEVQLDLLVRYKIIYLR